MRGKVPWNKGLTSETDERVRKNTESSSKTRRGTGLIKPNLSPSTDLAYVLGALKGDGWVGYVRGRGTGFINFKSIVKVSASSVMQALKNINLHPRIKLEKKQGIHGIWSVNANSRTFVDWYRSLSLDEIKEIIKGYESHFIRGFYEAEGSIQRPPHIQVHIYNTDLNLLNLVKESLNKIEIESKTILARKGFKKIKPCYQLYFCGIKKVHHFLQETQPVIKVL